MVPTRSSARPTAEVSTTGQPTKPAGRSSTCRSTARPHTLAYALNDSPAGLAAWLLDKYRSYSDCGGDVERSFSKDELRADHDVLGDRDHRLRIAPVLRARRMERTCHRFGVPRSRRGVPSSPGREASTTAMGGAGVQHPALGRDAEGAILPGVEEPELLTAELREFFRPLRVRSRVW